MCEQRVHGFLGGAEFLGAICNPGHGQGAEEEVAGGDGLAGVPGVLGIQQELFRESDEFLARHRQRRSLLLDGFEHRRWKAMERTHVALERFQPGLKAGSGVWHLQRGFGTGKELFFAVPQGRCQQRVATWKVAVEGCGADARGLGNLLQGGVDAVGGEVFPGDGKDSVAIAPCVRP